MNATDGLIATGTQAAHRPLWRLAVLAAAALLACSCGGQSGDAPTAAATVADVRVALAPTGNVLPVEFAEQEGIFERHGLHVTMTEGQDIPVFLSALDQGDYDVVMSVPTTVLVGSEHGLDVQVVSRIQQSSAEEPNAVWVTRDDSIDSLAQLSGTKIGVPALTGVLTDSLVYLLQRNGVDRDAVDLVPMPFGSMGDQLAAERVDAVVASIPFWSGLAARGFSIHDDVVALAAHEASGGAVDTGMTVLFASSSRFTREHPEAIEAWRDSLTEAIDHLKAHPDEARALLQSWLKMPPEVAERAPLPNWIVEVSPPDLQPYVTISRTVGTINGDPDVDSIVWQGP
ncbi:ABC transporter substrate-binding protein [Aldersonia sp. NBC_00410]|uniref:ABC transporter substrate-binding protein n=1 Tax=Aldersonia sp. NBC_00410 TaxID=2975954 RepID=UPI00224D9229|nr:ABC transporter substrate-binding protein [Aldersonia sp. NBC_00410]MCX5041625.1 ABC transporter substrate-binding protein [Aldersonia sp. NBC_00410]